MELEKDYILRMIKDLTKSISYIILDKSEIEYDLPKKNEYSKSDYLYIKIVELANCGKINEAEDMLFRYTELFTYRFYAFTNLISTIIIIF